MFTLPADISPEFAPTAQTLWVVWGKAPDYQVETGWSKPVYMVWALASAGIEGLEQIKKSMGSEFLATAPFEQVSAAKALLDQASPSRLATLWPTWLPRIPSASFFLRSTPSGDMDWGFGPTGAQQTSETGEAVVEGHIRDFMDMHATGARILEQACYKDILSDVRPVSPGHPEDWFAVMKCPEHVIPMRIMMASWHD
jgi:hypothetical protein